MDANICITPTNNSLLPTFTINITPQLTYQHIFEIAAHKYYTLPSLITFTHQSRTLSPYEKLQELNLKQGDKLLVSVDFDWGRVERGRGLRIGGLELSDVDGLQDEFQSLQHMYEERSQIKEEIQSSRGKEGARDRGRTNEEMQVSKGKDSIRDEKRSLKGFDYDSYGYDNDLWAYSSKDKKADLSKGPSNFKSSSYPNKKIIGSIFNAFFGLASQK